MQIVIIIMFYALKYVCELRRIYNERVYRPHTHTAATHKSQLTTIFRWKQPNCIYARDKISISHGSTIMLQAARACAAVLAGIGLVLGVDVTQTICNDENFIIPL